MSADQVEAAQGRHGLTARVGLRYLHKHPDKTFLERIEKVVAFLGCPFRPGRLEAVHKALEHVVARAIRLYEQEPGEPFASTRLGVYVQRWVKWVGAGLSVINRVPLLPSIRVGACPAYSRRGLRLSKWQ